MAFTNGIASQVVKSYLGVNTGVSHADLSALRTPPLSHFFAVYTPATQPSLAALTTALKLHEAAVLGHEAGVNTGVSHAELSDLRSAPVHVAATTDGVSQPLLSAFRSAFLHVPWDGNVPSTHFAAT